MYQNTFGKDFTTILGNLVFTSKDIQNIFFKICVCNANKDNKLNSIIN